MMICLCQFFGACGGDSPLPRWCAELVQGRPPSLPPLPWIIVIIVVIVIITIIIIIIVIITIIAIITIINKILLTIMMQRHLSISSRNHWKWISDYGDIAESADCVDIDDYDGWNTNDDKQLIMTITIRKSIMMKMRINHKNDNCLRKKTNFSGILINKHETGDPSER